MRIVTANQLQDWLDQGVVLEKDSHGPKVVRLVSGDLLKIFRSRRNPLLERLLPAARRFHNNSERLNDLGIATPKVHDTFWIARNSISACVYAPLQGTPLDSLFSSARGEFNALVPELAAYILLMHRRGIYFRSLHLGNILRTPDASFGLIDFLDIRFKGRPLGTRLVRRNFEHLRRYLQRRNVENFPLDELLLAYAEASKASS